MNPYLDYIPGRAYKTNSYRYTHSSESRVRGDIIVPQDDDNEISGVDEDYIMDALSESSTSNSAYMVPEEPKPQWDLDGN